MKPTKKYTPICPAAPVTATRKRSEDAMLILSANQLLCNVIMEIYSS